MRKRMLSLLLAAVLLLCGAGCAAPTRGEGDLRVICSAFPPYDFVRQIAGEHAEVSLLLKAGQESHTYEPSPKDIIAIQSCDVFIYVGGESEHWVEQLLDSVEDGPRTVVLTDCVELIEENGEHDEHVWTSPENAVKIVETLTDTLCDISAEHAGEFRAASAAYTAKLQALDRQFAEAVDAGDTKTLVFADRFPFRYFAKRYSLSCYSPFDGCSHHAEPSAATVAALIDKVKAEELPVVLYIEFSNQKIADSLCEATGAEKRLFHSCHNLTADEMAAGETYLSLMQGNLAVLKEALSL